MDYECGQESSPLAQGTKLHKLPFVDTKKNSRKLTRLDRHKLRVQPNAGFMSVTK